MQISSRNSVIGAGGFVVQRPCLLFSKRFGDDEPSKQLGDGLRRADN